MTALPITPGPWSVHPFTFIHGPDEEYEQVRVCDTPETGRFEYGEIHFGSGEKLIGSVRLQRGGLKGYPNVEDEAEFEANAKAVIAVPAMVEALVELVGDDLSYNGPDIIIRAESHADAVERVRKARDALKQAGIEV